jgi:hypothetical protein
MIAAIGVARTIPAKNGGSTFIDNKKHVHDRVAHFNPRKHWPCKYTNKMLKFNLYVLP